jgi:FkbM family methyltransferase
MTAFYAIHRDDHYNTTVPSLCGLPIVAGIASFLNQSLRRIARVLPAGKLRTWISNRWTGLLKFVGVKHLTIPIGGRTMRLRTTHRQLGADYEADALKVWLKLVRPGDTVWDIGANMGVYTVLTAQAVGPTGQVTAWEPAPSTFELLKDHVRANGFIDRCTLRNKALAEAPGTLPFLTDSFSMNRIVQPGTASTVLVEVETIDSMLATAPPPVCLKIDVEGAELLVLRGAKKLLGDNSRIRPVLLVGVHPQYIPEFGYTVDELQTFMIGLGYVWLTLPGEAVEKLEYNEFLLVPKERVAETKAMLG